MSKKMSKDVKYMVEEANKMLLSQHMQNNKEARDTLSYFVEHILLSKNMYHGFNYYKNDKIIGLKLAGEETNLIQFYIF